ncbi:insulin-like growth factor-binding protein complex acid labile subunit [Acanthaster planci]|uniref:Insulin-like growth factor-binding protein complex acid labile subunit n=1 Tax=Acanthaster planci TaxID=133434 RepID=A0A8B7ZHF1_ACAPL|nr:insulin-like growth factor-binding protein complex acid labile subunit [Acanthaster planci]
MSMDSYDVAMILFCVGCLVGSGQSSTCNVQCDYDHVTGKADCSHRNLDCIPVNYPDTLVMDLTHNNISVLDLDDFNRTFTRLVELYLDYNRVADVASLMSSTEMGSLTKLSVQHNIISNLGFPCSLDSLEFMLVDNNLLKYLHDFSNCQRLKHFSADSNELHSISIQLHRESFPSFVSLRFNRITNVNIAKTTTGVYNLTLLLDYNEASRVQLRGYPIDRLSLSHSKLQVINIPVPTKLIIASDGLNRLNNKLWTFQPGNKLIETLDIRNNSFDSLIQPDWAEGLQILHADDNILANLSSKTLKGFVDLKELHLASNRLLFISSTALSHLTMLRSLYLDGNFLTSLLGGIFLSQAELVELSITNNQLSFLHPDYFIGLNSLERLYLTRNRLLYVHSGMFRQMSRLNTLDISQNELNVFDSTNCSFLNHLENLLLAHNSIHDISCVLGHCDSLVMLNLSFNQIKVVPGVSLTGKNRALSRLELEGNPLQCDCRLTGLRDWLLNNPPSALPRCQGPPRYSGAVITNLGIHDFSCSPPKVMIKENQLNEYG